MSHDEDIFGLVTAFVSFPVLLYASRSSWVRKRSTFAMFGGAGNPKGFFSMLTTNMSSSGSSSQRRRPVDLSKSDVDICLRGAKNGGVEKWVVKEDEKCAYHEKRMTREGGMLEEARFSEKKYVQFLETREW